MLVLTSLLSSVLHCVVHDVEFLVLFLCKRRNLLNALKSKGVFIASRSCRKNIEKT